jgi:Uncharacterized alpha/beta hydrolase domain (DUF2235)
VWFAGNHSDVGGSYRENEARLSDISLGWMVHAVRNLPDGRTPDGFGIKVDDAYMKLHPDPLGQQHDEREPGFLGGRLVERRPARDPGRGDTALDRARSIFRHRWRPAPLCTDRLPPR